MLPVDGMANSSVIYEISGAYGGDRPERRSNGLSSGQKELTPEEQEKVKKLKARDTEVRAHERAHVSAGGQYVRGGARFEYEVGPDGRKYAVAAQASREEMKALMELRKKNAPAGIKAGGSADREQNKSAQSAPDSYSKSGSPVNPFGISSSIDIYT
jgi:hypothetical protein